MDHSRKMLRFRDMRLFSNPPTQHEALLRARSARSLRSQLSLMDCNFILSKIPILTDFERFESLDTGLRIF